MSKCKTIFSKNIFVSFEISILTFINKNLIIFVHSSTITRIELYITLSRLRKNKSMMKFIEISFQDTSDINKKFSFSYDL